MTPNNQSFLNNSSKIEHRNTVTMPIRNKLVNTCIVAVFIFSLPISVFSFYRLSIVGFKPLIIFHIFVIVLLGLLVIFRNHLGYRTRVLAILIFWLLYGGSGALMWGVIGMGISLHHAVLDFGFITAIVIACMWYVNYSLTSLAGQAQSQVVELQRIKGQLEEEVLEHKGTEEKLMNLENEKKAILDSMSNTMITFVDPEMKIIWANEAAKEKVGEHCIGHKCHKIAYGLDEFCPDCIAKKSIQLGKYCAGEVSRSNGITYYVQCNPVKNKDGDLVGVVVSDTDITERKQVEDELKQAHMKLGERVEERTIELAAANEALENAVINSNKLATDAVEQNKKLAKEIEKREKVEIALKNSEERYRSIIESIEEGYFEVDSNTNFIFFNKAFCKIGGYSSKEMKLKTGKDFIAPEFIDDVYGIYRQVFRTGQRMTDYCYDIIRKDGTRLTVESSISRITDTDGKVSGFRGIVRDVDERKRYEENLVYQAYHDALTGLHNRKAFYERVEEILQHAGRNNNEVALAFIDIDKFKTVNDTLGHEAGDEMLKTISERLVGSLRKTDYVSRIGGDEFTVIFNHSEKIQLDTISEKIIDCLSQPYTLNETIVDYVSASIGLSTYPKDAKDSDTLIKHADMAMYKAKESRNRFFYFSDI